MSIVASHLDRPTAGIAVSDTGNTAERLLDDIRELASGIAARAEEIEAGRRIPPDLVATLKDIGVYRMFVPRSHGGLELDLPSALRVISALARIDGSVGWTTMITNGGSLFVSLLPRETYDHVYRNGPVLIAGASQPAGTMEASNGGWRVSGRWPFASGCQHADWIGSFCVVTEGGKPVVGKDGAPQIRAVFLPAQDWQIEDTWHAAGLRGTGSHHVSLRDKLAAATNVFDPVNGRSFLQGPLYQSVLHVLPLLHASFAVGAAEGALDAILDLANTGRRQLRMTVPMRDTEIFQSELGRVAAEIRAARALLEVQAEIHWKHALAGTLRDETLAAQGTQAAVWIASTCVRAADACFTLGGGAAVYDTSPLQRRLRDLHTAAQHAEAQQRRYVEVGKSLLASSLLGAAASGPH